MPKFKKKDIPKLQYGIIHSQVGFSDGVSIVMQQVEDVMVNELGIPKSNINYLVGKAKNHSTRIRQYKPIWHKFKTNKIVNSSFKEGLGGYRSEIVEKTINKTKEEIKKFVKEKNIDILIVHNSSHPVNFLSSVALSRYFRDEKNPPKYILWWHDSHLERERYQNPAPDIKRYLLQGVPGPHPAYIIFINNLQYEMAQKYLNELDKRKNGYAEKIFNNHDVIYNTVTTTINTLDDLNNEELSERTEKFLKDFSINKLLKTHNLKLEDLQFCIQHTRIIPRKRIDFALEYCQILFHQLKKNKKGKALIFFVSGHSGDEKGNYKKKLIKINEKLKKAYDNDKFFLLFAEDFESEIKFEELPTIISKLNGFATYFSEIEGFGNNLLEVMAAGLIPIVYTYPVFKKDIAKYNFKVLPLKEFAIDKHSIENTIKLITNEKLKRNWADKNIEILKKKFSHNLIASKLKRAIIRDH